MQSEHQNYYVDKQYYSDISINAKRDLRILFFDSFFKDSKNILDIGCSVGRVLSIDPKRIQGIDIDKKALGISKKRGYKVKFADVTEKLPFKDESFDAIFCSQVIEHLEDPLDALTEMVRVLAKQGRLILITPDYLINSHKKKSGFWGDYTHKRPFTSESLKRIAYDSGFKKFRVYHFPGKGFRNLMRWGLLSKESWIKIEKFPFILKSQDIILEAIKS